MDLLKYRWSKTYEAGESELIDLLKSKDINATRWQAEMGEVFEAKTNPNDKRIWCSEGSITYTIDGNKNIPLQAGDALNIPANTMHSALAGFMGCVCFEYAITGAN